MGGRSNRDRRPRAPGHGVLSPTRPHSVSGGQTAATLPSRLRAACKLAPDAEALVDDKIRISWAQLVAYAQSFAAGLHDRGISHGDVVLIQLPNWWETVVATWGTWLAGAVVLPVVPIYRAHELAFIVDQVQPAAVITAQRYRGYNHTTELQALLHDRKSTAVVIAARTAETTPAADPFETMLDASAKLPAQDASADDIALILYTSGTASSPKGVLHSHRTLLAESASIRTACRLTSADRIFMPSPLSHITGLSYAVVLPADLGAAAVLLDRWDPRAAADLIENERCTFTVSATPFLRGLTEAYPARGPARSHLRTFICGGADIPHDLVRRAHRVLGTAVVRTYGSTEMPTLTMADPFGDLDSASSAEGRLIGRNQMDLRITDQGVTELVCRGPEMFLGYLDTTLNENSFTADGYFRTGDTASIVDGALRISGRIKDIINRGGEKYSAGEVESALAQHPLVADVAIVGYPDQQLGERACAVVVPAGPVPPTLSDLRGHLLALGFAGQKSPERLEVVDELPRTASGKVQKFQLRQRLG